MSELQLLAYLALVLLSSQGLGLLLVLLRTPKKERYNYLPVSLITVIMVIIFTLFLQDQPFVHLPHLTLVHQPFIFTVFPLFYLYVSFITVQNFRLKKSHVIHFSVPLLVAINLLPFYFSDPEMKTVQSALEAQIIMVSWWWHLFILCLLGVVYVGLSIRVVIKTIGPLKSLLSANEDKNTIWLSVFIAIFMALLISALIRLITNYRIDTELISLLLLSSIIIIMGLKYWFQWSLQRSKYAGSNLGRDASKVYLDALVNLVTGNKLYKNEKLTVNDLSIELDIPSYHISQIINQELEMSFWDFINIHRIEEAKDLLLDKENNPKILSVAYESGFNSKSAFYVAFKKHTGQTPTQFKKKMS